MALVIKSDLYYVYIRGVLIKYFNVGKPAPEAAHRAIHPILTSYPTYLLFPHLTCTESTILFLCPLMRDCGCAPT